MIEHDSMIPHIEHSSNAERRSDPPPTAAVTSVKGAADFLFELLLDVAHRREPEIEEVLRGVATTNDFSPARMGRALQAQGIWFQLLSTAEQAAAMHRPELFILIANWPDKRIQHWVRLLQARAIENQAYVVGVNRVGTDPYYTYNGHSLIADYNGEILSDAGNKERYIHAPLDLAQLRKYREGLPFLLDLR